jgi:hypothetical protein
MNSIIEKLVLLASLLICIFSNLLTIYFTSKGTIVSGKSMICIFVILVSFFVFNLYKKYRWKVQFCGLISLAYMSLILLIFVYFKPSNIISALLFLPFIIILIVYGIIVLKKFTFK